MTPDRQRAVLASAIRRAIEDRRQRGRLLGLVLKATQEVYVGAPPVFFSAISGAAATHHAGEDAGPQLDQALGILGPERSRRPPW